MADIHHWRHYEASPILPAHLPQMIQAMDGPDLMRQLLEKTVALYGDILPEAESAGLAPELLLNLAHSLSHVDDLSFAKNYFDT